MGNHNLRGLEEWICDIAGFPPYEELPISERLKFNPGQIYWGPAVYPLHKPYCLRPVGKIPQDESEIHWTVVRYTKNLHNGIGFPFKTLNLRVEENLFISKGKRRPFICLAYAETDWHRDYSDKLIIGIPLFTFKERHTREFIYRVQAFLYPNLFYIKPFKGIHEGAARLDLIQFFSKGETQPFTVYSGNGKVCLKLSDETYKLLWNHFMKFAHGIPLDKSLEDYLKIYQDLVQKHLGQ